MNEEEDEKNIKRCVMYGKFASYLGRFTNEPLFDYCNKINESIIQAGKWHIM